jgi:hypothetical protein
MCAQWNWLNVVPASRGRRRFSENRFRKFPAWNPVPERSGKFLDLLADAEFPDDGFVTLGIVSLEVVEQATPLADQHEQAAARAVVLLVRFEVIRQLANAFTNDGDLNLGTPRVSRMRLILVNDRFLLLSG